jgi:hypothetical protein
MTLVFWFSYVLLWVLVAVTAMAVFALYHHFGQMYLSTGEGRADQGPAEGTELRRIEVADLSGVPVLLPLRGTAALVIFTSTTCPVCERLRLDLITIARELPVVVFCHGTPRAVRVWAGELADTASVVADPRFRLAVRYEVGATPFGIAVGTDRVVRARGIVNDLAGLRTLADLALAPQQEQPQQEQPQLEGVG